MSNIGILEALQKTIQAIKQWLPFSPGDGASSIAQDGNQAFSANGTALGYNTIAGSKGYRISAFTPGDKDKNGNYINGTYTLVLNRGEIIPQEIKNSTYCIYLKQSKDSVGTVSAINGNVITVDGFLYPAKWDEGQWEELDENGNKTGNTLSGDAWEAAKAEAFATSYILFDGFPTIGNVNVGTGAHAEGYNNIATQIGSHAEGAESKALGKYSHAEGDGTVAYYSGHSEGKYSKAIGYHSHAEGYQTRAEGMDSHAEGRTTKAIGQDSHAEGLLTEAKGTNSHAEGENTQAIGNQSHSAGSGSIAYGSNSYAGGMNSTTGMLDAEGKVETGSGAYAFAHGYQTEARGKGSVALGRDTIATDAFQTVVGSFNDPTVENARFVVGIGDKASNLKNGFVVYEDGRAAVEKDPTNDMDVATKQYVDNNTPEEFIAFIDINADTPQEEIQAALDAVYGIAILSIKEEAYPYCRLTLSKNIKELYFENEGYGGMIDITGPGKYSDTIIFADHAGLTELYIMDVGAVYDSNPMFGGYTNCETIINCSGDTYINCDYLYDIDLYADQPDTRVYKIENAHQISGVHTYISSSGDSIIFNKCTEIDGVSINVYPLDEFGEIHTCIFSNCNSIKNVSIANSENITDEDIKVTYTNCNFIDPLTVYKAPNHLELNEELSELTRNLFPDANNSGNWIKGDNWYTVAQSPESIHTPAGLFKIVARSQPSGGVWTIAYILVSSVFSQTPEILVLSSNHKELNSNVLIDKVRVVTPLSYKNAVAYLQVHVTKTFTGVGKNGVSTSSGNGAEINIISLESIVDTDVSWVKKWTVGVNTTPFVLDESKYFVTEKSLLEDKLTSAKLYLHEVSISSNYSDEEWMDNPYFGFTLAFYRTNNTPITSLSDIRDAEFRTFSGEQFNLWDAPEAARLAYSISKYNNHLNIFYLDSINEYAGVVCYGESIDQSHLSIRDTVTEV